MSDHKTTQQAAGDVAGEGSNLSTLAVTEQTGPAQATAQERTEETGILPPQHWAQVTEDLDPQDDGDSTLGDDSGSTASITSTILQYRTIHGRTYHSERGNAQYWGSNDERQNESMDINHHVLTLCLGGKLYLAPLSKDIKKVLDIGTGTGIWAIDFADEFPNTTIIGTDISPIQPSWIPPNLEFQIDDCTQEWTFPVDSVDYVHMRWLVGSIVDWTALFKQAYNCLKPGGYIESYEAMPKMESDDGTVHEKSAMNQWGKFFAEGGRKIGRTFTVVNDGVQRKAMEEAGFVDIEEWNFKAPIGSWPQDARLKEIGTYAQATLEQDIEGYVLFLASVVQDWSKEELDVYIAQLRRELRSGKLHPYYKQKVVWGRKPATS